MVHGRRRVGKTELLEQFFRGRNLLKFEGIEGKGEREQRQAFALQLAQYAGARAVDPEADAVLGAEPFTNGQ